MSKKTLKALSAQAADLLKLVQQRNGRPQRWFDETNEKLRQHRRDITEWEDEGGVFLCTQCAAKQVKIDRRLLEPFVNPQFREGKEIERILQKQIDFFETQLAITASSTTKVEKT